MQKFLLRWIDVSRRQFEELQRAAEKSLSSREKSGKKKSSKAEGLFSQVFKTIQFLESDPRHNSLNTHEYHGLVNPYDPDEKVWEAYVQNKTPGAYRVFWCYGPEKGEITIIAITPHP